MTELAAIVIIWVIWWPVVELHVGSSPIDAERGVKLLARSAFATLLLLSVWLAAHALGGLGLLSSSASPDGVGLN